MRWVNLSIPVPSLPVSGLLHWVKDLMKEWKYRHGDETPRPIDLQNLKVEAVFRHDFPKNISQSGAEQNDFVREALQKFMSGLERDTPIASSFSSISSMVRIISPPVCKNAQLEDIIKYEARQLIPFDLREVEWRHLPAGEQTIEEDDFLKGKIILTAVKTDVVEKILKSFEPLRGQVDLLINEALIAAEVGRLLAKSETDSATAILEMHSEHSGLTVVDRETLWHRDIPLGGNHFTRQISRELKVAFEKAEHLKIHAMDADDPKLIFQAMQPTFDDLLAELKRSLQFVKSLDGQRKVETLYVTGGPSELPGVLQYLGKKLEIPVSDISDRDLAIAGIEGNDRNDYLSAIILAAQRLGYGLFRTNFIPKSLGFGLGSKTAWGIKIGQTGITAAKVSLRS
jgi:type IV pilus assembly protein PilM